MQTNAVHIRWNNWCGQFTIWNNVFFLKSHKLSNTKGCINRCSLVTWVQTVLVKKKGCQHLKYRTTKYRAQFIVMWNIILLFTPLVPCRTWKQPWLQSGWKVSPMWWCRPTYEMVSPCSSSQQDWEEWNTTLCWWPGRHDGNRPGTPQRGGTS